MTTKTLMRAALLCSAFAAAPAYAQVAPTDQAPPTNAPDTVNAGAADAVADIVVTAQRRPERLQNVPLSVTALSADTLKAQGLNSLAQITLVAPSLQTSGDNNFSVRGVGTGSFSNALESSVALALDDVNLTNPALMGDLFDVSQVEVLNGPQGLLFGKNASAGLLNVTTIAPQIGKLSSSFNAELSERDTSPSNGKGQVIQAAINLPVTANSALRIAGYYSNQDPLVRYLGTHADTADLGARHYAVRGKYLLDVNDKLSIYVIADYGEEHGIAGVFGSTYVSLAPGSIEAAPLKADGVTAGPNNLDIGGDGGYYRDLKRGGVQGKVSYTLDNGIEISNIAAWKLLNRRQNLDTDGTGQNGANINSSVLKFNQYSDELRVALPQGNRLSGQVGLYAFHSTTDSTAQIAGNNYFPAFLLPTFPFCIGSTVAPRCPVAKSYFLGNDHAYSLTSYSYAAFGQLTYKVTDALSAIAGGRVTHDKIGIDLTQNNGGYFVTLGIPFTGTQDYSNTNFSWKLGAQYNFSPNAMLYGFYGKGYKGPGFNDNAVSPTGSLVIKPETNRSIEAGVKTSWFNRRLIANATLFSSKFSNYQIQSLDLTTSSFVTQNAAILNSKGAEVSVTIVPIKGLTFSGSAAYLHARFGSFLGAACYPGQDCSNNTPKNTYDASGRRPTASPTFTSNLQATYDRPIAGNLNLVLNANYYHRSSVSEIDLAPGTLVSPRDVLGSRIGFRGNEGWRVFLFCNNCTDVRLNNGFGTDPGDANAGKLSLQQRFGFNSFRTIGLQFGFDF